MKDQNKKPQGGFSLIEMLIVLGVVGLLLAFAAPNLFSLINASTLTGEGTLLENQLTLAQQEAMARSADVEVRFFKLSDESAAQVEEAFRGYQLFQYDATGKMVPISSFFRIRPPAVIHERLSTLVQENMNVERKQRKFGFDSPRAGTVEAPSGKGGSMQTTEYVAFRFRPDGSTDLPVRAGEDNDTWYVTLVQGEGASSSRTPDNFVCIQVNPYNGQIAQFRP